MKTFFSKQISVNSKQSLRGVFCRSNLFVVILLLFSSSYAQSPDRTKPPVLGATPSIKINAVQKFILKNGLQVVVYEKHEVPVVQMNLVVKAGSISEKPEKLGLAGFTANMLDEGAGGMTALELSDAIDFLGSSISTASNLHTSSVVMRSTVSKFDETLKLFADIVTSPLFSETEMNRIKKQYLTALFQSYDQPRAIAQVAIGQLIFGVNHEYGRTTIGTEPSLNSISIDDLKKFYSTYYHPNNAYLIVAGDVTASEVIAKLENALSKWEKKDVILEQVTKAKQVNGVKIFLIDKPEAAQSAIRIGKVGIDRMTEDYFPLLVMNTILGGSFTSRLNNNLREVHGYTYGAGSSFSFRPTAGPFVASSDVQSDSTSEALKEFMKELNAISKPVSDDELNRAKNYLALGYPDNFSNVASIATQISEMVMYNLPENYFDNYIGKVLAVKKEDVRRVAKKYLDTDDLAIIIVGDKAKIETGLKKTKIGKIQNMTPIDILGPMPNL